MSDEAKLQFSLREIYLFIMLAVINYLVMAYGIPIGSARGPFGLMILSALYTGAGWLAGLTFCQQLGVTSKLLRAAAVIACVYTPPFFVLAMFGLSWLDL